MGIAVTEPTLGFGVEFVELYSREGLSKVDGAFLSFLRDADQDLHDKLIAARSQWPADRAAEAALMLEIAPHLEDFVGRLFGVGGDLAKLARRQDRLAPLFSCKRLFIQRRAAKAMTAEEAAAQDGVSLTQEVSVLLGGAWDELAFAEAVMTWLDDEAANAPALDLATRYAAWALHSVEGKSRHAAGQLFKAPGKVDPMARVHCETFSEGPVPAFGLSRQHLHQREGFSLTDHGADIAGVLDEINYCILCHHQGKDSCSKGMPDKKTGGFAKTALGTTQSGCPLEERISEMHETKSKGFAAAALAVAMVENPMLAGTGHRICNDCMAACVFTNGNRPSVNIPEVETRVLKDVLGLPWGFEIYSLFSRWNPMNLRRPLPKAPSGRTVLVVGLGPAGYTLSHHLMNDGHAVVAIDGLKIEPLPTVLSGVDVTGQRSAFKPIRDVSELAEDLGQRVMAGFGGVAEYGITVRWDKNFLKIIRLLLERRSQFLMFGGIRLGGTLSLAQAFEMGFDHVALCMGAGRPTVIDMPNNLAKGVRQASDFLMALQLTGAARDASVANLQVRLPVVVIGGGLTAVDSCTEALAYYPVQVEKFLTRFEALAAERGEAAVMASYTSEEKDIAAEFIDHARALRAEREKARAEGREADILSLLQSWGGAMLAYRRKLTDSPAYRNHEEMNKAFEEGIRFAGEVSPIEVEVDCFGAAKALRVKCADGSQASIPARTIIVAAGTVPNTVLAREEDGITLDGRYFQAIDEDGEKVTPERVTKPAIPQVLMHFGDDLPKVSFFGDLHPSYAGNVVSAMGSAKQGYPAISRVLARQDAPNSTPAKIFKTLNKDLRARVHKVVRLCPTIVEVVIEAPAAARAFKPGQFYRLQNFEMLAARTPDTLLAMEGVALTGAEVDVKAGLVSVIVLEMGGSSSLCTALKEGDPVVLMGPTGVPTETPAGETVLLAGGGLGNAVLFSIGLALRQAGSKVLYFAGYRSHLDRFKVAEIEAAADVVVWCVDQGDGFAPERPQDMAFVGNIVRAMHAYAEGKLGSVPIALNDVDRIIAIGSDRMMQAVAEARQGSLAPYLKSHHHAIGSINSPMQCMMKEICAQCLQKHRDPMTGEERVIFTCASQDQDLDAVDFNGLRDRLSQNAVHEKLTRQWIARELERVPSS